MRSIYIQQLVQSAATPLVMCLCGFIRRVATVRIYQCVVIKTDDDKQSLLSISSAISSVFSSTTVDGDRIGPSGGNGGRALDCFSTENR